MPARHRAPLPPARPSFPRAKTAPARRSRPPARAAPRAAAGRSRNRTLYQSDPAFTVKMTPKRSVSVNSIMKRVGRAVEFLAWAVFFALAALVLALRFWLLPDIERCRAGNAGVAARPVGPTT